MDFCLTILAYLAVAGVGLVILGLAALGFFLIVLRYNDRSRM